MFSFLRPFIAPAIMPFLGAALAYLATRFGIVYSPEQQTQITEGAVSAVLWLFATAASLTGIAKVVLNKKINPANAASSELVQEGKDANRSIRHTNERRTA